MTTADCTNLQKCSSSTYTCYTDAACGCTPGTQEACNIYGFSGTRTCGSDYSWGNCIVTDTSPAETQDEGYTADENNNVNIAVNSTETTTLVDKFRYKICSYDEDPNSYCTPSGEVLVPWQEIPLPAEKIQWQKDHPGQAVKYSFDVDWDPNTPGIQPFPDGIYIVMVAGHNLGCVWEIDDPPVIVDTRDGSDANWPGIALVSLVALFCMHGRKKCFGLF